MFWGQLLRGPHTPLLDDFVLGSSYKTHLRCYAGMTHLRCYSGKTEHLKYYTGKTYFRYYAGRIHLRYYTDKTYLTCYACRTHLTYYKVFSEPLTVSPELWWPLCRSLCLMAYVFFCEFSEVSMLSQLLQSLA